jgi:hypothetical protein
MHVGMDFLRASLAIGLADIALGVQSAEPLHLTIAAAMQEQPIGPHGLTKVTVQNNPLRAYFGHTALYSEDDSLSHFNAQIAACR